MVLSKTTLDIRIYTSPPCAGWCFLDTTSAEENSDASNHAVPLSTAHADTTPARIIANVCSGSVDWAKCEVIVVSELWAMQRANGDWFALDDHGAFRVPVFQSSNDAMQARAFNVEMLVFHPVTVDETALKDLGSANGSGPSHFWLVDLAAVNLKRGHRIDHAQLATLARTTGVNHG